MRLRRYFIALTLACCGFSAARAVVVYTDIQDFGLFTLNEPVYYGIDFNGDGVDDVTLRSSRADFLAFSQSGNRIAGFVNPPPNIESLALPFSTAALIGSSDDTAWSWNAGESYLLAVVLFGEQVTNIGLWDAGTSFLGVEFQIDGLTHYGWIEIEVPFLTNGGIIRGFAYETTPNLAISAGAIPEPAHISIIGAVLSLLGVVAFRRRRVGNA